MTILCMYTGIEQIKVNRQQNGGDHKVSQCWNGSYRLAKEKARMNMGDGIRLIYMQMGR